MQTVQWYPGHMAKALRQTEEAAKLADAFAIVLDARCPAASYNRKLTAAAGKKPVLYVVNKGDLADGGADGIVAALRQNGQNAIKTAAGDAASLRAFKTALEGLAAEKTARNREKGVSKPLRFLVAGIPNTGKSTLINLLAGGKKAKTGDKAGVTRQQQWVRCGAFDLLDTPGTMPPSCEDQTLARRLAFAGCLNDDALALDEIALCLLDELGEKYPEALRARYGAFSRTPSEMLGLLCKARGFLSRGGEYDYERGVRALLDDFRKGKLGRVCFDSVADARRAGLLGE